VKWTLTGSKIKLQHPSKGRLVTENRRVRAPVHDARRDRLVAQMRDRRDEVPVDWTPTPPIKRRSPLFHRREPDAQWFSGKSLPHQ
jgi:hypothetical protein